MKTLKFKWIVWAVAFVMVVCAFLFVVFDNRKVQVLTVQPYYDACVTIEDSKLALPDNIENDAKLIEVAAQKLQKAYSVCTYDTNSSIKNGSVPLDFVKNLGPNQIILWQGHGDNVNASEHPALWTNKEFDDSLLDTDPQYKEDYDQHRIVKSTGPLHDEEAISYKFIEKYCGNLTNSIIYLGPCESGEDSFLAQAFLSKGAAAVIASSYIIPQRYGNVMEYTTMKYLAEINPATRDYYTIGEALLKAKELYGTTSYDIYKAYPDAEALLFGNANYRVMSVHEVNQKNATIVLLCLSVITLIVGLILMLLFKNNTMLPAILTDILVVLSFAFSILFMATHFSAWLLLFAIANAVLGTLASTWLYLKR